MEIRQKVENIGKCYTKLRPDQKRLLHYSVGSFFVGLCFKTGALR